MFELLDSTLRLATPLIFAAMGGFFCERVGIATICLEGVLLTSAWTAATVTYYSHHCYLGLLAAVLVGAATLSIHSFLTVKAKADAIVSGVAVNLLAAGITPMLSKFLFASATNTPAIPLAERFQVVSLPLLSKIPFLGNLLFSQPLLVSFALLLPFLIDYLAYRTGWGLRLLACGDGPEALKTAGVSPAKVRYWSLALGGAIASLGGAYLSTAHASQFTREMTAGRGFIALTALIFGKWRPLPAFVACLFFGFTDALQIQLQSSPLLGNTFPIQALQIMPYLVTLFVLVGFIGGAKPPLSIGKVDFT